MQYFSLIVLAWAGLKRKIFSLGAMGITVAAVVIAAPVGWAQAPTGSPAADSAKSSAPTPPANPGGNSTEPQLQDADTPPPVEPKPKRPISEIRRPTTPTDAESLEARPPKPKFIGSSAQRQSEIYDLTFDDLAFEIEEGAEFRWSMLTPEIHQYDGAKIKLRGYIRPSFSLRKLKQFVFVRDNQECCFGPGAALFDCVLVQMADGKETDFTVRPVTLEGEFYLRKYAGPDGNVWAIYRLKNSQVK